MFKNVKKWAIALVLVFGLFLLVGCTTECPECKDPTESQCNELFPCEEPADPTKAECEALYPSEKCPTCEVCEECPACPECPEIPACVQDFVAPTSIILFGDDVKVGETFNLAGEMEVAPATAAKLFTWASSDPSIATVDADGVVTGVRPGKVEITAKSVLNTTAATTEVTVSETGSAFDIATREVAYIAGLLSGYIADDFALPKPWNGNVKVVYDVDGDVIESFVMPDLGEATSLAYTINYTVTFGDVTLSNTVNLKLVKEVEDNDFAKVDAAIEVATKLFSNITAGVGTDKISADIQLPPSYDGVAYNWTTNKNYILTNDGKFTRPDNDTTVTYTISPKAGAAAKSATLVFNINGYSAAEKHAYNVEEGVFAGIAGANVSGSFLLPLLDEKFGISYDYVLPAGLTLTPLPGGNGKYVGAEYDGVAAKTDAEIKVTARYEEEAGFQFIENYVIKVNLVPGNAAFADLNNFMNGTNEDDKVNLAGTNIKGSDLTVIPHMPYGGNGTENMVIKLPTTVGGSAVTWVADENFEEQAPGQFKLVTQYFRYHEAKLTATFTNGGDSLKAVFYVNVGIAEKPLTYYQGGRSNSYQASSNPAKRGDMLQGFSYWDKYVGTVASSGERTNQWWSEFSGYTLWIDEDVNYVNVKLTKNDTTGVITAVPEAAVKTIRYQIFVMEFEVNRIYGTQNIGGKHVARIDVRFVRSTYGGNFNHFLVNETGVDLDIPVSALSMGGYFADDETVMKTYSLTSLKIGTTTVLDDYGASFKVSREQSIAYDGYRPGFSLKSNGNAALLEGQQGTYDLYMGSTVKQHLNADGTYKDADANAQEVADSTRYLQYRISPVLSTVYKTPYVVVGAGAYGFQWHSQGYYSLGADITRAFTGGVRGVKVDPDTVPDNGDEFYAPAKITVARYTRHVNNEELTDYFVRQVNALSTDYSDVSQAQINAYKAVQKIYAGNNYGAGDKAWVASWLAKTTKYSGVSPKEAKATLDKIAVDTEAAAVRQRQFAESVHDKINALAAMHAAGGYKTANAFDTTTAFKDVNNVSYAVNANVPANTIVTTTTYNTLRAADQANFAVDNSDATRVLVLKSREATTLMADADTLYAALTPGRLSFINGATYDKLKAAKVELQINELSPTPALDNAAVIAAAQAAYNGLTAAAKALVTQTNVDKVKGLSLAIQLLSLPADSDVTTGSKTVITNARKAHDVTANDAQRAFVSPALLATLVAKEEKLALAYKASTLTHVANIKAAAVTLLDDDAVDFKQLTTAQLTTLTNALNSVNNLINAYKALYDFNTLQASAAVDNAGNINNASKVIVYYYDNVAVASKAYTKAEIDALSTAPASLVDAIKFIEAEKIKKALDANNRPVIDATFGMMSGRDDRGRIDDLYDVMDIHNGARADDVEDIIDALPAERALVVEDEAKIVAARAAYNGLNAAQKALVAVSRVNDLIDLEAAIIDVKLEAIAKPVEELIYALPNRITLADAEAVAAARAAYNALTPKQKAKVNGLKELTDAEEDIATLQREAAAESTAVAAVIADLTNKLYDEANPKCKVTSQDVATIKAYIAAFDALLGYEQAYILSISGKAVNGTMQPDFATRLALYREAVAKVEFFTPAA